MLESTSPKVYRVKNGSIDFSCPACGFAKSVDVARFLDRDQEARVRIRCKCRSLASVLLDRRVDRLLGSYSIAPGITADEKQPA